ncbi:MAG TPA: winged helix-turn-helix domain-containing protein [Roseiflexaceae bacterium]|nr:winged helix-turn-helix domain-containing protein [Roseiflexaceae bacterium]
MTRIVVHSTHADFAPTLEAALGHEYMVQHAATEQWLRVIVSSEHVAAIYIDGRCDGVLECCQRIRTATHAPLIAVAAGRRAAERVRLLNAGVDDVVRRPLKASELRARLHAKLRRAALSAAASAATPTRPPTTSLRHFPLSPTELRLLAVLQQHDGAFVPAELLQQELWDADTQPGRLRFHISHLRRRLEGLDQTCRIEAQRGQGYRLVH